jgi:phage tail-like protein
MSSPHLPSERLDALTADLEAVVRRHDPEWTGARTGDPGITLVELLSWVADSLGESALASARSGFPVNPSRSDPYRNFKFRVKWDGTPVFGIRRVSGLGRVVQATEYRDGGDPNTVRPLPGVTKYEPITLERGITSDTAFEEWANQARQASAAGGSTAPADYHKDVRIEVLNQAGQPVLAYDVYRCWPTVYRPLPELDSTHPMTLVESITLVHDGWKRDPGVIYSV